MGNYTAWDDILRKWRPRVYDPDAQKMKEYEGSFNEKQTCGKCGVTLHDGTTYCRCGADLAGNRTPTSMQRLFQSQRKQLSEVVWKLNVKAERQKPLKIKKRRIENKARIIKDFDLLITKMCIVCCFDPYFYYK